MQQTAFVKVSGDLFLSPEFIKIIDELSNSYLLVICVGGGRQINQAFESLGEKLTKHGPLGRELHSVKDRQLAKDILEKNKSLLEKKLSELKIIATVIIPVLDIGPVLCHVNGDQFVRAAYIGFDKLFIVTTPDRKENKKLEFASLLDKIEVLAVHSD